MRESIFEAFAEFGDQKESVKTLERPAPTVFKAAPPLEAQSSSAILSHPMTPCREIGPSKLPAARPIHSTHDVPHRGIRAPNLVTIAEGTLKPIDSRIAIQKARNEGLGGGMDARLMPRNVRVKRSFKMFWPAVVLSAVVIGAVAWSGTQWFLIPSAENPEDVTHSNEDLKQRPVVVVGQRQVRSFNVKRRRRPAKRNKGPWVAQSSNQTETNADPGSNVDNLGVGSERLYQSAVGTSPVCGPYSWRCEETSTNTAVRLPKRLTFGLRIDLSLSEPASTLGGPVAAVTIADVQDPESRLTIPSGTVVLFVTATNDSSGRVAIDWTKPPRLLLTDDKNILLHGYIVGEDGSLNLPATPFGNESRAGETKRIAQGLIRRGGQYASRRNTIVGDLVNSSYREISQHSYQREESPILVTPSGTRFSLTIQ